AAGFRHRPAPLLEEEGRLVFAAGATDLADPGLLDRAMVGAALASDDDPINAGQVELRDRSDERLTGEKAHGAGDAAQMVHAINDAMILDACAQPHVVRRPAARVTRRGYYLASASHNVTGHVGGHPTRALG